MAKSISKLQVQEIQSGKVKLVDIRTDDEYQKLHIPGAMNIPTENLDNALALFNENDTIVCICNHGKERAQQAAEILIKAGFKNTFYLEGGTAGWKD